MKRSTRLLSITLMIILMLFIFGPVILFAIPSRQVIDVQNPDFEGRFRPVDGVNEMITGESWYPGWSPSEGHRCEWKPERADVGSGRVYNGTYSQKWFTTFSPHRCWIWQQVDGLSPGRLYKLTAQVYIWSSREDNPDKSIGAGKVWIKVGVNPWADSNAMSESTQWGTTYVDVYDKWKELEVVFRAVGSSTTVFLMSRAEYGAKHNDAYWDEVRLEEIGSSIEPTPSPCPTCTPGSGTGCDYDTIRDIVRGELDKTRLSSHE